MVVSGTRKLSYGINRYVTKLENARNRADNWNEMEWKGESKLGCALPGHE
jgi:hypothetical protein